MIARLISKSAYKGYSASASWKLYACTEHGELPNVINCHESALLAFDLPPSIVESVGNFAECVKVVCSNLQPLLLGLAGEHNLSTCEGPLERGESGTPVYNRTENEKGGGVPLITCILAFIGSLARASSIKDFLRLVAENALVTVWDSAESAFTSVLHDFITHPPLFDFRFGSRDSAKVDVVMGLSDRTDVSPYAHGRALSTVLYVVDLVGSSDSYYSFSLGVITWRVHSLYGSRVAVPNVTPGSEEQRGGKSWCRLAVDWGELHF
ncbi:hypothetical protein EGR_10307 [Echinococcus granulosus]|uniref:Uncharacterized protein n=1 Tax=Echinococcus granulosus TaxID=6210 RepID=W6U8M9_ECHGR|nr:hypothetical protein EGR_10307 [Echinococcus granulosus]EUB54842.1 hypothetical protein EGR_10307 [Echinococcus granulosus]